MSSKDSESKQWSRSGPSTLLVNPASATCGRGWETGDKYIISLRGDHSNMVKFSENDRDGYEKVRDVLQDFITHADAVIKNRLQGALSKRLHLSFTRIFEQYMG